MARAGREGGRVPAFKVFTDVTLQAIAERQPADEDALADITGVGPMKSHDDLVAVLTLVRNHL